MAIKKEDIRDFLFSQPTLFEIEESAADGFISPAEASRQSELAKMTLETLLKKPVIETDDNGIEIPHITWANEYFALLNAGWTWRVAAYISWASSKKIGRVPDTQEKFARDILGLTSDRAISTWRQKNPAIDEAVGIMQTYTMFDYRRDAIEAMGISASDPTKDGNRDRKLLFQMTGDWAPSLKIDDARNPGENDLAKISTEELKRRIQRAQQGSDSVGNPEVSE